MKRLILLFFISATCYAQTPLSRLNGRVVDTQNKPIQYASILVNDGNVSTYSNEKGEFSIRGTQLHDDVITLKVSFVGMQTISRVIQKADYSQLQLFVMDQLSLTLTNVVVSSERKKSDVSNSAILFDRQSIEQVQAFSLMDVLNNLPGKKMSAPDLQYRQNITLRTAAGADPVQQANNSLGVALYVDGFRQANDANMQSRNVGLRGLSGGAITNHRDPDIGNPQYDSPFGGLDIRSIPADNIESIEVVSGVAAAKYGEMTDGAIIIQRKAGVTPYQFSMRLNGTSTNYSLSKGLSLGKKAGAMNFNFNYLNSIQDPRNSIKNYRRVTGGVMWTTNLSANVRNTFSADFSYKKDNAKIDPDDVEQRMVISLDRKVSFSNRTNLRVESPFLKSVSLGLSYDKGYSNSYSQTQINKAVQGVADKDTTGIYEGYYIPGIYLAKDHIIGEPYNYNANLSLDNDFETGRIRHALSLGASFYTAGNSGQGIIADPNFPASNIGSSSMKSERPYNFDLQQNIVNGGFYLQDQMRYTLFNRELSANAGLRYDIQNGSVSLQPRINTSYQLSKRWSLRAAYGISTKAPGMSQRNPPPTYFDIPLLNLFAASGKVNESLYLVYTQKVLHDNSFLKPSRSSQFELGVSADYHFFNTSLYGYVKKNSNGYNTVANFIELILPVYNATLVEGSKPVYQPSGLYKVYTGLSDNKIDNSSQSDNYGIEWFVSTRKIRAIQTSVNMNTSFSYSRYNNLGFTINQVGLSARESGGKAYYGIYPARKYANMDISTKISTDTHIPKLGFVVSVMADIYWKNQQRTLGRSDEPIAYIDEFGNYIPIPHFDSTNPDYGYLAIAPELARNTSSPPFVYGNLSLRIAKEMNKKFRISVYAYNFLNIRPSYYNDITASSTDYNSPVNVGAEVSFKF